MNGTQTMYIIVVILFSGLLLCRFIGWIIHLKVELKYLNIEIGRTAGREQRYWRLKRRKLLLSVVPFVRYR